MDPAGRCTCRTEMVEIVLMVRFVMYMTFSTMVDTVTGAVVPMLVVRMTVEVYIDVGVVVADRESNGDVAHIFLHGVHGGCP